MFGIKIPRTIHEAYIFDQEHKNNKWAEAVKTEVNRMGEHHLFKKLYQRILYHFAFEENFDTSNNQLYKTEKHNWDELYPGAHEEIPKDLPEVLGNPVEISTYFDAGFANDLQKSKIRERYNHISESNTSQMVLETTKHD